MSNDLDLGFTDIAVLATDHEITNSWTDVGVIDTRKRNKIGLLLDLDIGTSASVQFRLVMETESDGSDEYSFPIISVAADLSSVEPEVYQFTNDVDQKIGFEFNVNPALWVKLQVKDSADGTGTLSASVMTGLYGG